MTRILTIALAMVLGAVEGNSMGSVSPPVRTECSAADHIADDEFGRICGYFREALSRRYPERSFVSDAEQDAEEQVALEVLAAGAGGMQVRLSWDTRATGKVTGETKGFMIADRSMTPDMVRRFVIGVVSEEELPF